MAVKWIKVKGKDVPFELCEECEEWYLFPTSYHHNYAECDQVVDDRSADD